MCFALFCVAPPYPSPVRAPSFSYVQLCNTLHTSQGKATAPNKGWHLSSYFFCFMSFLCFIPVLLIYSPSANNKTQLDIAIDHKTQTPNLKHPKQAKAPRAKPKPLLRRRKCNYSAEVSTEIALVDIFLLLVLPDRSVHRNAALVRVRCETNKKKS
ncbi:hypothetical protein K457DRAFT_338863 [Linnemannia elongata AG-77]|uniref:Uncharacterized protein n=1 Tax=Linnemannia elongata AG-77 TaxID=1314771 RepID=A0A197K439_9FUNG|nr:hypothetical protein K457DRAFT_338863 [Linnemannia elongata AG-77]